MRISPCRIRGKRINTFGAKVSLSDSKLPRLAQFVVNTKCDVFNSEKRLRSFGEYSLPTWVSRSLIAALSWPTNACTTASGSAARPLSSKTACPAQQQNEAQLQSRAFARATEDSKRQALIQFLISKSAFRECRQFFHESHQTRSDLARFYQVPKVS